MLPFRVPRLRQHHLLAVLLVIFICGMLLGITLITSTDPDSRVMKSSQQSQMKEKSPAQAPTKRRNSGAKYPVPAEKIKPLVAQEPDLDSSDAEIHLPKALASALSPQADTPPNYDVHAFYYPWYGNPEYDGQYYHWNHELIQHWDPKEAARWPKGKHVPPDDVGASFYPELGPYSSRDPAVLDNHMQQMLSAGIGEKAMQQVLYSCIYPISMWICEYFPGTLAVSWYPPGMADENGKLDMSDELIPLILEHAAKYNLKVKYCSCLRLIMAQIIPSQWCSSLFSQVCLHIEPYPGRNHLNLRDHLQYVHQKYSNHSAYYTRLHKDKMLPLFYIYDSYHTSAADWASILNPDGALSVRGSELDAIFIGLIVEPKHKTELLVQAGFDGYYTYFASTGFSFGSQPLNWKSLAEFADSNKGLFIPSVGPGYDDERVRPWNARNSKHRGQNGEYYSNMFKAALHVQPPIISITSFNEWGEGTQIEKAVPKSHDTYQYHDYLPHESDFYLSLTKSWVSKFTQKLTSWGLLILAHSLWQLFYLFFFFTVCLNVEISINLAYMQSNSWCNVFTVCWCF